MMPFINTRVRVLTSFSLFWIATVSLVWAQQQSCQPEEEVFIQDEQLRYELGNFFQRPDNFITCADLLTLTHLSVSSLQPYGTVHTLEGFQFATNLEAISLPFPIAYPHPYASHNISDLTPLAELSHLKRIYMKTQGIKDISPLGTLNNLEDLSLMDNFITDLSPLTHLRHLKNLQLSGNPIEDLNPLKDLTKLEILWLGETGLTFLYGHPKPKLDNSDIQVLTSFKALKSLDLSGNPVSDLAPLRELSQLETLNLSRTGFRDVTLLEYFPDLQTLSLQETYLKSIEFLASISKLTSLRLDDNYIQDLSPLEQNLGLGAGDTISLEGNCLDLSPNSEASRIIAELEARGITVNVGTQRPASECSR
jgi:internalin A